MVTVLLVDDKPVVLQGLRMRLMLEPDLMVVGEARNGRDALTLAQALHPDVVVMDVEMPDMDGITTTKRLRELVPDTAVVLLSVHCDVETQMRAHRAGAAAFVEKRGSAESLVQAVRDAALGITGA